MKTAVLAILIPIIFLLETIAFLCSFTLYAVYRDGNFYTEKLIDKL